MPWEDRIVNAPGEQPRDPAVGLVGLAREVSQLEAGEGRRRVEALDPATRVAIYRIALALGLPWPVAGRFEDPARGAPEIVAEPRRHAM